MCKLTQVIHTDLILLSTEKDIEGKKLDIMAQEEGGNIVAIENQFGVSDFKHLGQIISYAILSRQWTPEDFLMLDGYAETWNNMGMDSYNKKIHLKIFPKI